MTIPRVLPLLVSALLLLPEAAAGQDFVHADNPHLMAKNSFALGTQLDQYEYLKPRIGTQEVMVILLEFSDALHQPANTPASLEARVFGDDPSINGYFQEVSQGLYSLGNAGVVGWYVAPQPAATYYFGPTMETMHYTELGAAAVQAAVDHGVDFAPFDTNHDGEVTRDELLILMVLAIHPDEYTIQKPYVMATRYDQMQSVGIIAPGGLEIDTWAVRVEEHKPLCMMTHELAHGALALQDLYGDTYGGDPSWKLTLMAVSWDPYLPHLSAWEKLHLGWLEPVVVTQSGVYTVPAAEQSRVAYILYDPNHGTDEYFIVENRWPAASAYEVGLPDSGLAVWHITESYANEPFSFVRARKMVAMKWAGGGNSYSVLPYTGLWEGTNRASGYDLTAVSLPRNSSWEDGTRSGITIGAIPEAGPSVRVYFGVGPADAGVAELRPDLWFTDGEVLALARLGETLYLGGNFAGLWPPNGAGAPVDATSGVLVGGFPRLNGDVHVTVPDGSGGWFVGGAFDSVGGVVRHNLARIRSDLQVDAWDPAPDGEVRAMFLSGSTLYVGGRFNTVGGAVRGAIAALDATTGAATAWNPILNDEVRAIAVSGSTVYIGGLFTSVSDAPRNHLAALSAATGQPTAWNPAPDGTAVWALAVGTSVVYVAGDFAQIGGGLRNSVAAIDRTSGSASAWNPAPGGPVLALALSGSTLYAGGAFAVIGGQARQGLAALSTTTGAASSWNPACNGGVLSIALSGSTLYAGGFFRSIGGATRNNVAAIDRTTAVATAWNPHTSGPVEAVAVSGSRVYVGGEFRGIGGVVRGGIAALNLTTGEAAAWNPGGDGVADALALSGSTLYVGGTFSSMGGQARSNLAAVDATSGLATAWNPATGGPVLAIVPAGSVIYAGGLFSSIGGQPRNRLAAIDAATGQATAWDPNAIGGEVRAVATSGGVVYAGGAFTGIGGQARNRIAAIDAATGQAAGWNPDANGVVNSLAVSGPVVYAGGGFTSIGGQPRTGLAALDATSGAATAWNPAPAGSSASVHAVVADETMVLASGGFTSIGGQNLRYLAALDPRTGAATDWNPAPSGQVETLLPRGWIVYSGGSFSEVCGRYGQGVAAITRDLLGWGMLVGPPVDSVNVGVPSDALRCRIWVAGVTDAAGASPDVVVELGYGPGGSDPRIDPAWHWTSAAFARSVGSGDEYTGQLTVAAGGTYDYCFRSTWYGRPWLCSDLDGSLNGYSTLQTGKLVVTVPVAVDDPNVPKVLALGALGNPFQSVTRLRLALPRSGHVDLSVFDIAGRHVQSLADAWMSAGLHTMSWDRSGGAGKRVSAGVYFARVTIADQGTRIVKLVAFD